MQGGHKPAAWPYPLTICHPREGAPVNLQRIGRENKSSEVAEMNDRLATIDSGRKVGATVLLSVEELSPHLTQCRLGRGLPPYQVAS